MICLGEKFVRGKNVDVRKRCKGDESVKKQKVNEEACALTVKKVKKSQEDVSYKL